MIYFPLFNTIFEPYVSRIFFTDKETPNHAAFLCNINWLQKFVCSASKLAKDHIFTYQNERFSFKLYLPLSNSRREIFFLCRINCTIELVKMCLCPITSIQISSKNSHACSPTSVNELTLLIMLNSQLFEVK